MAQKKKSASKTKKKAELTFASPSATEVLEEFLNDQQKRLAASTMNKYASVIGLLKHSMHNYAWNALPAEQADLFGEYEKAGYTFCDVFGPEHIMPNVNEFLNWFMPHKVMCGQDLMRAAGTVTRKLATWLANRGYVDADQAAESVQRSRATSKKRASQAKLKRLLDRFTSRAAMPSEIVELMDDGVPEPDSTQYVPNSVVEGMFDIARVQDGLLWLETYELDQVFGPFELPVEITNACQEGWTISGVVGRVWDGKNLRWHIHDVWSVR